MSGCSTIYEIIWYYSIWYDIYHLQLFWNSFQNAKICWEAFARAKHLIIRTLTFQIYCSNNPFLVKIINNAKSTWQNQNCLEECNKLCKYQTRYLVRTFIFIISTWCVYHAIHLCFTTFDPHWHKCSF